MNNIPTTAERGRRPKDALPRMRTASSLPMTMSIHFGSYESISSQRRTNGSRGSGVGPFAGAFCCNDVEMASICDAVSGICPPCILFWVARLVVPSRAPSEPKCLALAAGSFNYQAWHARGGCQDQFNYCVIHDDVSLLPELHLLSLCTLNRRRACWASRERPPAGWRISKQATGSTTRPRRKICRWVYFFRFQDSNKHVDKFNAKTARPCHSPPPNVETTSNGSFSRRCRWNST